jgi:hypothetical protein
MRYLPSTSIMLSCMWRISFLGIVLAALGLSGKRSTLYYSGLLLAAPIYLVILPIAIYFVCRCYAMFVVYEIHKLLQYKNPIIEAPLAQAPEEDVAGK